MEPCHRGRSRGAPPQKTGGHGLEKMMTANGGGVLGATEVKSGVSFCFDPSHAINIFIL